MGQELSIQQGGQVSPKLSVPRAIASVLSDNQFSLREWTAADAVSRLAEMDRARLAGLATQAAATLQPANPQWLNDRLSTMYLAMSHDTNPDKATAWLHETIRLLADIPLDIVGPAIDEAVKRSERGFLPSVGAIRAIADPQLDERRQKVARLRKMADAAVTATAPRVTAEPFVPCSPEDAASIMQEYGIGRMAAEKVRTIDPTRLRGPKSITVEDYVALGLSREDAKRAIAGFQR